MDGRTTNEWTGDKLQKVSFISRFFFALFLILHDAINKTFFKLSHHHTVNLIWQTKLQTSFVFFLFFFFCRTDLVWVRCGLFACINRVGIYTRAADTASAPPWLVWLKGGRNDMESSYTIEYLAAEAWLIAVEAAATGCLHCLPSLKFVSFGDDANKWKNWGRKYC